jgi:hypothetical protein
MFRSQITFFILFLLVGSQGFATKKIIPRLTTLKTILEPFSSRGDRKVGRIFRRGPESVRDMLQNSPQGLVMNFFLLLD